MALHKLQLLTLEGVIYDQEVAHIYLPAEDGFVGILAHHAPYVTSSPGGILEVREKDGTQKRFRLGAGFFEVAKNRASFFAPSIEKLT
ncbi:MAG: F0F1 ATP synthase subunit epsilon [Candidatus Omnitrophica bacterium]|nr:F0F1 ATP synthase subunit epsilon [Candidatus Omnitrophota bacterium]